MWNPSGKGGTDFEKMLLLLLKEYGINLAKINRNRDV
jgi:hypothetical protein